MTTKAQLSRDMLGLIMAQGRVRQAKDPQEEAAEIERLYSLMRQALDRYQPPQLSAAALEQRRAAAAKARQARAASGRLGGRPRREG